MTILKKRAQLFFQEVLKCMEDLYDKSASEVGLANQSTVDNTSLKQNESERIPSMDNRFNREVEL